MHSGLPAVVSQAAETLRNAKLREAWRSLWESAKMKSAVTLLRKASGHLANNVWNIFPQHDTSMWQGRSASLMVVEVTQVLYQVLIFNFKLLAGSITQLFPFMWLCTSFNLMSTNKCFSLLAALVLSYLSDFIDKNYIQFIIYDRLSYLPAT